MKESTGDEPFTTKELGIRLLDDVERKAFEIYKKALDSKEYSEYYILELMKQNESLKEDIASAYAIINKGSEEEFAKIRREKYKVVTLATVGVVTTMFVPTMGVILIPSSVALVAVYLKKRKKVMSTDALLKETTNRFQKVTNILTNIDNNETFLNKKYKELSKSRIDESQKNPDRVSRIMEANLIIQDYISDERLPKNIDEETKRTIITMLQQDLGTKERNLETLLMMAKDEVSKDTLTRELKSNN